MTLEESVQRRPSRSLLMRRRLAPMESFLLIIMTFSQHSCAFLLGPIFSLQTGRQASIVSANVVAEIARNHNFSDAPAATLKLSRPGRKARERERKQQRKQEGKNHRRKHNYSQREQVLNQTDSGGRYDLHSTAVRRLTHETSSAQDVMRAIKRAQNLHDVHDIQAIERFLLEQTNETFAYGYRGSLLARLAVAALHMENHPLARKAMDERLRHHRTSILPMESAAIIRGLLRVHNVTDALFILNDELQLPPQDLDDDNPMTVSRIKHRALALASIASRHFFEKEPGPAVLACQQLAELGPLVRRVGLTAEQVQMPWSRILTGAAQCDSGRRDGSIPQPDDVGVKMPCNVVYAVLNAMTTFPADHNDRIYEILSNALVRRVEFVTGAIDMESCPRADRGEAVFVGRSNVGKSSLINMITNRKSLAFTSKRPGKTQQFNFFAVNDKVGLEKEIKYGDIVDGQKDDDSFYMVDLPGFGYAQVPEKQRQEWSQFMHQYLSERKTLRVVFHLVDARHGPTVEDAAIMKQIGKALPSATFVVVLTKTDKNVKGAASSMKNPGKVSSNVMDQLRTVMKENGVVNAPVLLTSSETKLGRDDLWRYLRLAAEA